MRKIVFRFREVDRDKYQAIVDGKKTIETRAATKKFEDIKVRDLIIAVCGKDKYEIPIKKVTRCSSIEQLFEIYDIKSVLPGAKNLDEAKSIYYSFPNYKEKIEKNGIVALELR